MSPCAGTRQARRIWITEVRNELNRYLMTRSRPTLDVLATLVDPTQYPLERPLDWPALFGHDGPVEIEVGSGKGLFLATAATERPGHQFLGIELSKKYAKLAAERAVKHGLGNIKVWPGDARIVLARLVPESSVKAVHVYFPDPWWKKRHKKRRVFNEGLVAAIVRGLEPSGELHVATDVEEYFGVIQTLIAAEPSLTEAPAPVAREPEHNLDYLTNFERKFRIEGRPIFRARYVKGGKEGSRGE
jgi:tRNA (guanine-N7-)-methyltransferase